MIYLDNAATTAMYPECLDSFKKYGVEKFFNPSAVYAPSVEVSRVLKEARREILSALHAPDGTVVFTASGSEADNLALFGSRKPKGGKIVTTAGEHSAVINSVAELSARGYEVVYAPLHPDGKVNLEELEKLLDESVCLVSVMHVNNETGAVNDLKAVSKLVRRLSPSAIFHSDGVQGFLNVETNLKDMDVDLYSMSAHKIHGPKGVGALYMKKGIRVSPIVFGGGQEYGIRSATENVPGIDAFRVAVEIGRKNFAAGVEHKKQILSYLREEIGKMDDVILVSNSDSPHVLTVTFKDVRGEVLMHALESHGIFVGIGSACSSKKGVSRFKDLLGLDKGYDEGIVRISVSENTSHADAEALVEALSVEVPKLRKYKRI